MKKSTRFEMRIPAGLKARLRAAAQREGRSLASYLLHHAGRAAAATPLKKELA
jgi:uncharacterized protein (DUF1778 family)